MLRVGALIASLILGTGSHIEPVPSSFSYVDDFPNGYFFDDGSGTNTIIDLGTRSLPPVPSASVVTTMTNLCVVVWGQDSTGLSQPTNLCIITNAEFNTITAAWDPVAGATNYVLGWSRAQITNQVPDNTISWTNCGLSTTQTFYVVPPIPVYGLIFLQAITNGTSFNDLTSTPYLRLTNGAGGPLPWQWFRSRTELTTNWR